MTGGLAHECRCPRLPYPHLSSTASGCPSVPPGPGVGVLPESETLTEGERADLRHCPECGHDWSGHVDPPLPFMTCSGKRGLGSVSGCRCVLTQADVVERILASRRSQ